MRSWTFFFVATAALAGCGQTQTLGDGGGGGTSTGTGGGTTGTGGGAYDPCAGKACGDTCTLCAPNDPECSETAEVKSCDANGTCTGGAVQCGGTCTYDGNTYTAGQTFPATDGCNTCTCLDDGSVACTEIACQQCGGIAQIPCNAGSYCNWPDGSCGGDDGLGVCAPIPEACDKNFAPVCGCDGTTYGNACEAAAAGVSVVFDGACDDKTCGGLAGKQCGAGDYCHYADGTCGIDDNSGVCEPIPQNCPDNVDPVCACGGITYSNACDAAAAGASIDHLGAC